MSVFSTTFINYNSQIIVKTFTLSRALQNTGGVCDCIAYPDFEDRQNVTKNGCSTRNYTVSIQVQGYIRFKVKNESELIPLLTTYGPLSTSKYALYLK